MTEKLPTADELAAVVRAGLEAYRELPDDTATRFNLSQSPTSELEYQKHVEASKARNDAKDALRQLLEMARRAPMEPSE